MSSTSVAASGASEIDPAVTITGSCMLQGDSQPCRRGQPSHPLREDRKSAGARWGVQTQDDHVPFGPISAPHDSSSPLGVDIALATRSDMADTEDGGGAVLFHFRRFTYCPRIPVVDPSRRPSSTKRSQKQHVVKFSDRRRRARAGRELLLDAGTRRAGNVGIFSSATAAPNASRHTTQVACFDRIDASTQETWQQ